MSSLFYRSIRIPLTLVSLLAFSVSCRPVIEGPVDIEVMKAGELVEDFDLEVVELRTTTDLFAGKGELFDFTGEMKVLGGTLVTELKEQELSYDELIARGRESTGHELSANLSLQDDVWVADDFDSLNYLTSFFHFEEVFEFANQTLGDEHPALVKGLVGFNGSLVATEALPIPLLATDNAAYVPFADSWLTFKLFLLDEGVPLAMNRGVIAHEFHHRVFSKAVFSGSAFPLYRDFSVDTEPSTEKARATGLIRGLDEGLADLFAVAFTGQPDFMSPSLKGVFVDEGLFRDLTAEYAQNTTYDQLRSSEVGASTQNRCGSQSTDLYSEADFNFYCVGTVVATSLYEASGRDVGDLREVMLPAVERALFRLGDELVLLAVGGELFFDLDIFLQLVGQELDGTPLKANFCQQVELRFTSLMPLVTSCL